MGHSVPLPYTAHILQLLATFMTRFESDPFDCSKLTKPLPPGPMNQYIPQHWIHYVEEMSPADRLEVMKVAHHLDVQPASNLFMAWIALSYRGKPMPWV